MSGEEYNNQEQDFAELTAAGNIDKSLGMQALKPSLDQAEKVDINVDNHESEAEKLKIVKTRLGDAIDIVQKLNGYEYTPGKCKLGSTLLVIKIFDELNKF